MCCGKRYLHCWFNLQFHLQKREGSWWKCTPLRAPGIWVPRAQPHPGWSHSDVFCSFARAWGHQQPSHPKASPMPRFPRNGGRDPHSWQDFRNGHSEPQGMRRWTNRPCCPGQHQWLLKKPFYSQWFVDFVISNSWFLIAVVHWHYAFGSSGKCSNRWQYRFSTFLIFPTHLLPKFPTQHSPPFLFCSSLYSSLLSFCFALIGLTL